jgi:outer membrane protein TolC
MRRWFCLLAAALAALPLRATDRPAARVITLNQAYDIALATDQSIGIAYQEIRKANLLTWSALATHLGPQLSGNAGYDTSQTHGGGLITRDESSSIGLNFSQPLMDFSVFPAYRYGKLAAVAARLQHQYTIRQVLFGVATAYYQVLTQQGVVAVDQKTVDLAAQQLDVAQKRLNVGEVTQTDALNAQVTLESSRVSLIEAKNTLLLNRDTLGNILNLGGDTGFQLVTPPDYPTTIPDFEKLLAIGYRNREDLKVSNLVVEEDIAKKGEVIAEYAPRIVGNAGDNYTNARGLYGPQTQVWDASVSVSMPFLTGGQREIDLRTAREQVIEDRLTRDQTAKKVEGDVRQAWLNARSLRDSLVSLKIQVEAAQKSYSDLRNQYQAGTSASVDVLVALVDLNTSENNLAVQINQYQVALRNLEEAVGVFQQQRVEKVQVK